MGTYGDGVHTGQGGDSGRASENEHGRHDDVGRQPEEHEDEVCECAPACGHDLEPRMRMRSIQLELRRQLKYMNMIRSSVLYTT